MMYTNEQAEKIKRHLKELHSSEENDVSLCQYNGSSCVRCCLPHIGGDSTHELSKDERTKLFNKDNLAYRIRYENRYVGPKGILMKFNNFHPIKEPGFEVSHYEDSFEDEGQEEIEKNFSRRRKLFLKMFNPKEPDSSIAKYERKTKKEEGYRYKPSEGESLATLFFGGSIPQKNCGKGEAAECHLLGFLDEEKKEAGCLAHPFAPNTQGYDGRDKAGFFHNDSCSRCSCTWSEEFRYLSDSARKVFERATNGMSWYDHSRHGTAVLVAYLRSYDNIIQMIDKKGKLDKMSLENLVEFTNNIFDNWPLKEHKWSIRHELSQARVSKFPVPDKTVQKGTLDWFTGTEEQLAEIDRITKRGEIAYKRWKQKSNEYEKSSSKLSREESKNLDSICKAEWGTYRGIMAPANKLQEELIKEVPYKLISTNQGYLFEMNTGEKIKNIEVIIKGNQPFFSGEQSGELWRLGLPRITRAQGKSLSEVAKLSLIAEISQLNYRSDNILGTEMLTQDSIPIKERIMYHALDSLFFKEYFTEQVAQAREHIRKEIEKI